MNQPASGMNEKTTYERAKKTEKNAKANGPDVVLARKGHKADATTSLNASERPLHDYFAEVSKDESFCFTLTRSLF